MAFCGKCGAQVNDGVKFCPACGAAVDAQSQQGQAQNQQQDNRANDFAQRVSALNNTADSTAGMDPGDIAANKGMAVLSYFGPLVLIPIFASKESRFARFHANQGLTLLIVDAAYFILSFILNLIKVPSIRYFWGVPYEISATPWFISLILWLIAIPITILAILGIINAVKGRAKELPLIGKFKLLK